MEQKKIDRINELARKQKSEGLTPEELGEQKTLREEYIRDFRAQFSQVLENTVVEYPDGSRKSLHDAGKTKKN